MLRRSTSRSDSASISWWLWPNIVAVDAPMVAIAWYALFTAAADVPLQSDTWAALGCAVWTIYLADRWLDGVTELPQLLPERHRFWMGQRGLLAAVGLFAVLCGLWFGWRAATAALLYAAIPVTAGAAIHLAMVHYLRWPRWPKEAAVGAIFAAGVLTAVASALCAFPGRLAATGAIFALLCWLNCVVIEDGEWHAGLAISEPGPWVGACGRHAGWIAGALALISAAAAAASGHGWRHAFASEAAAALALGAIGGRRWLDATALAPAADLALLLPAMAGWLLMR